MHELGVAAGILDIVRQYVPESRAARVRRVHVRVGEMAGVLPDSLEFCFGAIVAGTPYGSAVLAIERVPLSGVCAGCGAAFAMLKPVFSCPECGGPRVSLVSGAELMVNEVELDDQPSEGGTS